MEWPSIPPNQPPSESEPRTIARELRTDAELSLTEIFDQSKEAYNLLGGDDLANWVAELPLNGTPSEVIELRQFNNCLNSYKAAVRSGANQTDLEQLVEKIEEFWTYPPSRLA